MNFKNLLIVLLVGLPLVASAEDIAAEIRALKKQIEELNQKVKTLEQKTELAAEAAETKSKAAPLVSAGADGFVMRSADTNFVLRIFGYGQFDGRFYSDGAPLS